MRRGCMTSQEWLDDLAKWQEKGCCISEEEATARDIIIQLQAENARLREALRTALHYTECYHMHFPTSGANYAADEAREALAGGE